MHRLKTSSFVARKFSPPLSLFLPLARLRSLTFYLYYFPPLPLASYPSPSSFPFSRVSCTTYTPSFITLRSSIFISRSPEIFTVFFVLTHIQRLHARPRFSPVGIALRDDEFNVGIKRRDLWDRGTSKRAKGEGKRVRPLFYPGLIAPFLLPLLRSFIFKSTPRYRWQCWHLAIKRACMLAMFSIHAKFLSPFYRASVQKSAKYFVASIRQAIDLSVANEQKYIYLFFRQSIRINIELIIESCINCLPSEQNLSAYHA